MLHFLAQELNEILQDSPVDSFLSALGKRLYFPKGIIAQSAEAKQQGKKANATVGITVNDGKPAILPCIQKHFPYLNSSETVAYAPTAGLPELREAWKTKIIEKNPALKNKTISLPVVVPGLTAGISVLCDLFLDEDEVLLACDPCWDNYGLIVEARSNAKLKQFPMFWGDSFSGGFNLETFTEALEEEAKTGIVKIILNFPQNPSGYSPSVKEAEDICALIKNFAEKGTKMLIWCDDAYFGLAYEEEIDRQSLFAYLSDIHENVVAVKIDGPTKEDYVWGFRTGFLTFGGKGLSDAHFAAIEKKLMGAIRSSVSCSNTASQSIMLKMFQEASLEDEKKALKEILKGRYKRVKSFLETKKDHEILRPLPFNSGYFMSFRCEGIDAEELRQVLLHKREIGTISIDERHLRVAFSSVDKRDIENVFTAIYEEAENLKQNEK